MSQTTQIVRVDTRTVPRRTLNFASMDEITAELDRIEAGLEAGTLTTSGNWTPGQNFDHLGKFLGFSLDGFPSKAPAPVRLIAQLMLKKKATQTENPFPAGFKLPKKAAAMLPRDDVTDQEGLALLRKHIARVQGGEKMTHPSPLFGTLTHKQWLTLQRKHMALHLSFLHPDGGPVT